MAVKEVKWKFEWENENEFKLTQENEVGEETVLVMLEENGCIKTVWGSVTDMVAQYLSNLMGRIGKDMKEEAP